MVYLRLKSMDGKVESESSQGVYRDELAKYSKMSVSSQTIISFFKSASRVKLQSLRAIHKSKCGVPNSTVKVTNILKEFNKVTLFVTYFYIRTKLAIVGVVVVVS